MTQHHTRQDLIVLKPRHASFVGIDSDGCVFDTMEIKQKQCFHKLIVTNWHLEAVEKQVRETAEFVNLYSKWRGQNRFAALLKTFELLAQRRTIRDSGVALPNPAPLRTFVNSGVPLGNPELLAAVKRTGDPDLAAVLRWSHDVNAAVATTVRNIPPFPWVVQSLEKIRQNSDAICVSQTPTEALVREWAEHDLVKYVAVIAGQELGTKTEHLAMATGGKYAPDKVLMIGDAMGDLLAATSNRACFYPINPSREAESWKRLCVEAYDRFLAGTYAGAYQDRLVQEFKALLPEEPPWRGEMGNAPYLPLCRRGAPVCVALLGGG